MERSTISTARKFALHHGGRCLSTRYRKGHKLEWECAKGHKWKGMLDEVLVGGWCAVCNWQEGGDPLLQLRKMAKGRGGICLAIEYLGEHQYHPWQCAKGHQWLAKPEHMRKVGSWCPHCAGRAWLGMEPMHKVAAERGGKCLSTEYLGGHVKLRWECDKGHEWEATPAHVRHGHWCPHHDCRYARSHAKLRGSIGELREIAKLRGGKLVSRTYVNRSEPVKWRCAEGHTWMACVSNVKFGGTWCPHCPRKYGAKDEFKKKLEEAGLR
jgi:hypothetical protein